MTLETKTLTDFDQIGFTEALGDQEHTIMIDTSQQSFCFVIWFDCTVLLTLQCDHITQNIPSKGSFSRVGCSSADVVENDTRLDLEITNIFTKIDKLLRNTNYPLVDKIIGEKITDSLGEVIPRAKTFDCVAPLSIMRVQSYLFIIQIKRNIVFDTDFSNNVRHGQIL